MMKNKNHFALDGASSDDCFRSFLDGIESWAAEMAAERKRMGKDSGVS